MSSINPRKIICPQCKKETVYSTENPFRPFCCERCRLIDLGQWADEAFRVPIQENEQNPKDWSPHQDDEE